jgi:aspartate racemase
MDQGNSYKEIAGIIGGIGPEATSYFTSLLIKFRLPYAAKDQDHIPYLLFNNPQIPDRSEFILNQSSINPLPEMIRTGLALKNAGATFLVIPCNTAHTFAQALQNEVGLPLINIVDETAEYIHRKYGNNATVGVLATTGTIYAQLHQSALAKISPTITVLTPTEDEQAKVMKAIYDIKSNSVNKENTQELCNIATSLVNRGASTIILGCTEIPLALKTKHPKFFRIDPMEILAQKVIERTILSTTQIQSPSFFVRTNAR